MLFSLLYGTRPFFVFVFLCSTLVFFGMRRAIRQGINCKRKKTPQSQRLQKSCYLYSIGNRAIKPRWRSPNDTNVPSYSLLLLYFTPESSFCQEFFCKASKRATISFFHFSTKTAPSRLICYASRQIALKKQYFHTICKFHLLKSRQAVIE